MAAKNKEIRRRSDLQQSFEMSSNVSYNSAKNVLAPLSSNVDETEHVYEEIYEEILDAPSQANGSSTKTNKKALLFIGGMVTVVFAITVLFIIVGVIMRKLSPMNMNAVLVNNSLENNTTSIITSCSMLPKSSNSGYYWILSSNGSTIRVYCDMKKTCGSITGGWMRVTSLDMKQNSSKCPSSLCLDNSEPRTCRRCYHDGKIPKEKYDVGVTHSHVCGRVIAYQIGETDGYRSMYRYSKRFDGVSLFHDSLDVIWSFVAASQVNYKSTRNVCPCINPNDKNITLPPAYIGNNYFCDTATSEAQPGVFYNKNPLWDGHGCTGTNMCCSFNNPPWFYRKLEEPTTEAIVMRIKMNKAPSDEDLAIEIVDIYVL